MAQARGSLCTLALYEETTYGADPGTPAGKKLYFVSESLNAQQNLIDPATLTGSRLKVKPALGNFNVAGQLNVELGAENHGTLLKHAIGACTDAGAGPYTHTIVVGDLPVGLVLEKDYGTAIGGASRYEKLNGCRIGGATFRFPTEGFVTAAFDVVGSKSTFGAAILDANTSLDDSGNTPFSIFEATVIEEGGSSIAYVQEAEIRVDNGLDDSVYALGGAGARRSLPEGMSSVSGSVTALFESAALLTKARAATNSSLKITLSRGTGAGSSGNESIEFLAKDLIWEPASPVIDGPAGLKLTLNFRAFKAAGGSEKVLQVIVKNALATV